MLAQITYIQLHADLECILASVQRLSLGPTAAQHSSQVQMPALRVGVAKLPPQDEE